MSLETRGVKSGGQAGTWQSWWEEGCASYKGPAGEALPVLVKVPTVEAVLLLSREQQEQLGGTVTYFSTQSRYLIENLNHLVPPCC